MAMRDFTPAVPPVDLSLRSDRCHSGLTSWGRGLLPIRRGSGQCHKTQVSRGRGFPQSAEVKKRTVKELWQDLFADPSQWWDNRSHKEVATYPDFEHKKTQETLWLNSKLNPPWVEIEVAAMLSRPGQLNLFGWNKKLKESTKSGHYEKTLETFLEMQKEGMVPNKYSFVPVLNACASLRVLEQGRRIHTQSIQGGFESDLFVGNSLIDMYTKCRSIEDAWGVFSKMPKRDVVSWNAMIQGYVKCGQGQKALELSRQMQCQGVEPSPVTFVGLLNACASLGALKGGRHIHDQIIQKGCEQNIFVGNSLIDMYSKCGSMDEAFRCFKMIFKPNVVAWSAMIQGYVKCGQGQKALDIYRRMQLEGVQPNTVTFVGVLNACASVESLDKGRLVHEQIIHKGCDSNTFVGNSLIDMYAKCGSIEDACKVFSNMSTRDVVSWNIMIMGFVKCGLGQKALELFGEMQSEGVEPNSSTFVGLLTACSSIAAVGEGTHAHGQVVQRAFGSINSAVRRLVDMYAKCGNVADAWRLFCETARGNSSAALNAKIQGFVKSGEGQKALKVSQRILNELVEPDSSTCSKLPPAHGSVAALEEGRRVHQLTIQRGCESDVFVGTCLVDMYIKCGSVEDAWRVFDMMSTRNVVTWSTMIHGLAKQGQGRRALELFREMQRKGVEADQNTFVGVLNACAMAIAVGEGRRVDEQIIQRGWECDLFVGSSLVDMYAKCGSIDDALRVFNRLPTRNVGTWGAMILGYIICGQQQKAVEVSQQMQNEGVDPGLATFTGLLNALGAGGHGRRGR